jgi:nucleosome assembly protein 1-like 1
MDTIKQVKIEDEDPKTKIYATIAKETSNSLKKKLLYVQKLNEDRTKLEDETYEAEYRNVKYQYDGEFAKLLAEINAIVQGNKIPTLGETDVNKYKVDVNATSIEHGIPDYWSTVFANAHSFVTVNENDEKILKFLKEVRIVNCEDKLSFKIEFVFSPNDYFTNDVLFKHYIYDSKDREMHKVDKSKVEWKSADLNPNKITKTKTVKSKNIF